MILKIIVFFTFLFYVSKTVFSLLTHKNNKILIIKLLHLCRFLNKFLQKKLFSYSQYRTFITVTEEINNQKEHGI
jgi:Leu/Phe-tRNA-protein transferase